MARDVYCCCDLPEGDGAIAEPPEKKFSFSWVGVGPPNEICEPPPGGCVEAGSERGRGAAVSVATIAAQLELHEM